MKIFGILFSGILFAVTPLSAVKVHIESVGQGNFVRLSHGQEVIFVDGGSKAASFTEAYRKKAIQQTKSFELPDLPQTRTMAASLGDCLEIQGSQDFQHDSTESSSCGGSSSNPSPEKQVLEKREASKNARAQRATQRESKAEQKKKKGVKRAGEPLEEEPETKRAKPSTSNPGSSSTQSSSTMAGSVLDKVYTTLPRNDVGVPTVKTILITHPDEDHYNLFPQFFPASRSFLIETLILSGLFKEYNEKFQEWVTTTKADQKIREVICTGRVDGGLGDTMRSGDGGYARPYYTDMGGKTPVEQKIDAALSFSGVEGQKKKSPRIEILSMNAGYVPETPGNFARRANWDSNTNSTVLRVSGKEHAIVLAADANEETWEHILSRRDLREGALKSTYLLVSHHGSREEGASDFGVLTELFQPKCCFLSVGRHQKYHHPHQDTLSTLFTLPTLAFTERHDVSYFGPKGERMMVHRRKGCDRALFSTLNHGMLEVDLDAKTRQVMVSQILEKAYKVTLLKGKKQQLFRDNINVFMRRQDMSLDETIQQLQDYFTNLQMNAHFWKKADRDKKKLVAYHGLSQIHRFLETQHILISPKEKFYWLKEQADALD